MAENVKRRVAAARLAVAFVAAGTIAGATAWAQASPPPAPTAHSSSQFDAFLKIKNLTGANILDGSLLYKDFKHGQVPSEKQIGKLRRASTQIKKVVFNDEKSYLKQSDLNGYIKFGDGDSRYIKQSENVVFGEGSVFTASKVIPPAGGQEKLLDVSGMLTLESDGQSFTITNTSGGDLTHTSCGGVGGVPAGTLQDGKTLVCPADGSSQGVQLINGAGKVATVNFSAISGLPNGTQATVQILVGL
jgi:hypothetical protein